MDTHELAWAAGFWDGEGNTGIQRHTTSGQPVHMQLAQSGDPNTLIRFQNAIGGLGHIRGPYDKGVSKITGNPYKLVWVWATNSFEHSQQVMVSLWPWLSTTKRDQMTANVLTARSWRNREG